MKPSDDPEYFRRAPPPGRSRESTLVLDEKGRFWHEGNPVEHAGMAAAFAAWVQRHPDNGRYILNNGHDWSYLTVVDAPVFVVDVIGQDPARPVLRLSSGGQEPLDPSQVWVGAEGVLYTRVNAGQLEAKFSRSAQTAMLPLLVELPSGEVGIAVAGTTLPVPIRGPGPGEKA